MPEQLLVDDELATSLPSHECRVHERLACDLSTSCQPTSAWGRKDSRWAAVINEISQGGIRLIVRRRFEPGSGLGIELPGTDGDEPYTVLAKVVHVQALPGGSWALGCQFISELSEDEVLRLLPRPPQPEKNRITGVTLQLEVPRDRLINCRIQRLTVPGSWPLAAGATLAIRANSGQGGMPLLKLKVVWCRLEGGSWTLRCQLLNPSDELLRAILKH
jgi:hypothetical protein